MKHSWKITENIKEIEYNWLINKKWNSLKVNVSATKQKMINFIARFANMARVIKKTIINI